MNTSPDAYTLRQLLAAEYLHADRQGGFVSAARGRRARNYTQRLVILTGLSREQVIATAREDAQVLCLMDDGEHAPATPGQDLCPACQARMDQINH